MVPIVFGSMISTDKSECFAKCRFVTVFLCLSLYQFFFHVLFIDEHSENGNLPSWLMSMFICSCFISDNFPLQAKAIDCMLQQFVLSSTQSELHFSEDQRIIPSITKNQLSIIKNSYNLFLVSAAFRKV